MGNRVFVKKQLHDFRVCKEDKVNGFLGCEIWKDGRVIAGCNFPDSRSNKD